MAKSTKTKTSEKLTETTEEVKAIEVVETKEEIPAVEEKPKAVKALKVKWDFEKLASNEMIVAITKFRNNGSQDSTELEVLANSCIK